MRYGPKYSDPCNLIAGYSTELLRVRGRRKVFLLVRNHIFNFIVLYLSNFLEVLLDRTNSKYRPSFHVSSYSTTFRRHCIGDIYTIQSAYRSIYRKDLNAVIRSELSVKTERLFNMALVGNREEGDYVDQARVQADVKALYKAGQGQMGTDEITM
jgi:hypothetical protein